MKLLKQIPDRPVANWLIMFVMATAIMMLLSRDSYLYLLGPRCDSAWFFMCGKAWMNGLVPYVDFADSKGPLLWLIYGVGYLLSHYDYHGVFWVSVVFYSFTFYFLFKTARIFLERRSQAILAVLMTSVFIFNPITHDETRAEDFGMFFTALSLWQLCRILYAEHNERDERMAFFAFGISLVGTLLIKYNITAMCCIFPAIGLYYLIREHHSIWRPLLACVAGFAALALPFLIYFLIQGNFSAFIQEYFINTLQTIEKLNNSESPIIRIAKSFKLIILNKYILAILIFLLLSVILFAISIPKNKKVLYVIFFTFLFITQQNTHHFYYFAALNFMALFFPVAFFRIIRKRCCILVAIVCLVALTGYSLRVSNGSQCMIFNNNAKKSFEKVEKVIRCRGVEGIKICNIYRERGIGIKSESLPATKYWARQGGYTREMNEDLFGAVKLKKPDVVVMDTNEDSFTHLEFVENCGYRRIFDEEISTMGRVVVLSKY